MNRYFNRVPPLSALSGFEAAARLGSFSKAADELNMTQSAISHQIKSLEDFFGQQLFTRVGRSVELSDAGRDFQETAKKSLEMLARGTRRLESYRKQGQIVLATPPSLAKSWLLPRFGQLVANHPDLQPWLYTSDELDELDYEELDIAIWRGDGKWPGMRTEKLFDDWISPVCSPELFSRHEIQFRNFDISSVRLLHDERNEDWFDWCQAMDVERSDTSDGFNFSDSGLLLESAVLGHGLALGSLILAKPHLEAGRLVQPFSESVRTEHAYYLACVESQFQRPTIRRMWDWLIEQGHLTNNQLQEKSE